MAFAIHLPNLLYIFLAWARHDIPVTFDLSGFISGFTLTFHPIIQTCIVVEQFGYGLGFTAFMVYLLYISKGKYKTSHYAISTGIMALGYMLPQFLSGFIQTYTGYFWLFVICSIVTVPGMLTIFFLPFDFGEEQ
jgi:PAT family beta-lactamase induction signal transducer AmpG